MKKLFKALGIGGTGAAAGAATVELTGMTAAGIVGGGAGIGLSALALGLSGGAIVALGCYGIYKCFK